MKAFILVVVLSLHLELSAKEVDIQQIPYASKVVFNSEMLDVNVSFMIYLPKSFHKTSKLYTYPVIFINGSHGEQFFHSLTGVTNHLGKLDRMPESIVVTLNGDTPDIFTNGMWLNREKIDEYGDIKRYIQFLERELFPYLESEYRANSHRTIIGVSGSSLFPLASYIEKPNLFSNHIYLASHDMIGMGLEANKRFIDDFDKVFNSNSHLSSKFYFGIASRDMERRGDVFSKNASDLSVVFKKHLDKDDFKIETLSNEDHYNALIKALLSAFELLYPKQDWAPNYRDLVADSDDALKSIQKHYDDLSDSYGYTIFPKIERWNSPNSLSAISRILYRDKKYQDAFNVAEYWSTLAADPTPAKLRMIDALSSMDRKKTAASNLAIILEELDESSPYYERAMTLKQQLQ
ncbi:MAG: hypothetical protein HWD86_01685 [Kangiellaceae bacterium]|nr:hypothetical protein [Kangiellaceae bacterium]